MKLENLSSAGFGAGSEVPQGSLRLPEYEWASIDVHGQSDIIGFSEEVTQVKGRFLSAIQAEGRGFKSLRAHQRKTLIQSGFFVYSRKYC